MLVSVACLPAFSVNKLGLVHRCWFSAALWTPVFAHNALLRQQTENCCIGCSTLTCKEMSCPFGTVRLFQSDQSFIALWIENATVHTVARDTIWMKFQQIKLINTIFYRPLPKNKRGGSDRARFGCYSIRINFDNCLDNVCGKKSEIELVGRLIVFCKWFFVSCLAVVAVRYSGTPGASSHYNCIINKNSSQYFNNLDMKLNMETDRTVPNNYLRKLHFQ